MKNKLRFSLISSLVAGGLLVSVSSFSANAQELVVQGNTRVEEATIKSYFNGQSAAELEKDLTATGLFSSVKVTKSGSKYIVKVAENNIINRVAFEGNKKLVSEVLEGELQLKSRGAFSEAALQADTARLKEVYERSGRSNAQISSRVVPLPNGKIDVVFTIVEGDKTGVKTIDFTGNNAFSAGRLRDEMTTTQSNFMSWIKTSDIYDPDRLAADAELVRRFYLKNGYADVQITGTDVQYDVEAGGYKVVIGIDEGKQYRVGSVNLTSSIANVDADSLRSSVKIAEGDVYNSELVDKTIYGITADVSSRGYVFSQVRPQGDRDSENAKVNLTFTVEEGPRVYVERINIRGNTRTRDNVIRREFDVGEGDAYNKVLIDRTERRLNNLGFFKQVRITNEPGSAPDRVIINVDVEDQATGQFSVAFGYSTSEGAIGEVGIRETNLLGQGQDVRVKGSTGQYTRGVEFNYTEPYFMDRRLAAGVDLYSKESDNSRFARYSNTITGGTLRAGFALTEETKLGLKYSLYNNDVSIPSEYKDGLNNNDASTAIQSSEGQNLTSLIGYSLTYNTVDNVNNPRSGILAEFKQDFAGLGGDSKYIKTTGDVKYYHEITDSFVGLLRGQGGYMLADNQRIIDNFFMGPNLVRGFTNSGIGPRDNNGNVAYNALGGTTYVGGTAELQFPLFGLPREAGLKGSVFADAGTLFGFSSTKPTNYVEDNVLRTSIGTGILWQSPIGPIRLDFAWPVTQGKYDETQVFRFVGGTAF